MIKFSIHEELQKRILVLDGGLGTMVQGYELQEQDYRGERFADCQVPLKGCNDLLVITSPDVIFRIHEAYLLAGADIISTDTFNANAISLADYNLQEYAYELNRAAARLARSAADKYTLSNPSKPRFVAGSVGPTNRTASMSADVNNPASREVTFDDLVAAYSEQVRGMADGGVDLFLIETIFDTLNAKAAIFAIERLREERGGTPIPMMISGTLTDASGRTLSGQVVEAFYTSIAHARPLSVGLNCAFGARQLRPYLARLASVSECRISAHPNAGLPNVMGGYDESPAMMAADVEEYLKEGLINIIGGCCGTTPAHIGAIAQVARRYKPRPIPTPKHETTLSGLEPLKIVPQSNFVNVGERANVAGSAKFARLIREQRYDEALSVAREQVESGAQIVDVCMDDGLINGTQAMTRFLNLAMSEPDISRVPIMIDSSSWDVLEAGLKCVQGKSIVNSISLKEGEQELIRRAKLVQQYGAAAVVMLFDERGQADTFDRKIEVAKRAYDILTTNGFPAEDIIFDPNILAIGTGIEEHNSYGVDFIEACRWIKSNLPHAKVSGGVSNLSFSFRGNNTIREAIHSVFLYHAIAAGMDMGLVNPSLLQVYTDIPADLLALCEDVVLNRRPEATEELTAFAQNVRSESVGDGAQNQAQKWRQEPLSERIAYALIKGVTDYIEEDTQQAYNEIGAPLEVIDKMLMPAMARIGELFGEGKMFLPQVVKSARVMKRSVSVLTPYIEALGNGQAQNAGRILVATVKGDVHDIGKNIVSVVMACNGYLINDMGVMVECERIVDQAVEWNADVIGLSGLITPSLEEMTKVVAELQRRGLNIPVIIGGATTSQMHTAVKIAPVYDGIVVQSKDASENIAILSQLMGKGREIFAADLRQRQQSLREQYAEREQARTLKPLSQARREGYHKSAERIIRPNQLGRVVFKEYPISEVAKYIDWNFFFSSWGIKGHYPGVLDSADKGEQARKLFKDAQALLDRITREKLLHLNAVVGIFPARREQDTIIVTDEDREIRMPQLRNQEQSKSVNLSLADYIAADSGKGDVQDYVCAFALTSGLGLDELSGGFKEIGDDYNAIMSKLLADRLAEAFAEALHSFVRRTLWGYESEPLSIEDILAEKYEGVRYAFGYPACPDHSLKGEVFDLLHASESTSMELTENHMINPGESICGLIFADSNAKYFNVGHIDSEQMQDYASRRAVTTETIAKIIGTI